jgi:cytoskeletal protein RodZ
MEWFWPQKVSTSLFECIKKAKEDVSEFDKFIAGYVENVASILDANFSDALDGEDRGAIKKELAIESESELVVVPQKSSHGELFEPMTVL